MQLLRIRPVAILLCIAGLLAAVPNAGAADTFSFGPRLLQPIRHTIALRRRN